MTNDEMRELCEKATKGPWTAIPGSDDNDEQDFAWIAIDASSDAMEMDDDFDGPGRFELARVFGENNVNGDADAVFIAACRSWVPFALEQLAAARRILLRGAYKDPEATVWVAEVAKGSP